MIMLLIIIGIAFAIFYGILNMLDISGTWKFILVFVEMMAVSQLLIWKYKFSSELGLVLVKSKKGIELIEKITAKTGKASDFLADIGGAISYGLLSRVILKKNGSMTTLVVGLAIMFFLAWIVGPTAFLFLSQVMKMGAIEKSVVSISDNPWISMALISIVLLIGGLFLFVVSGIIFYGAVVFSALAKTVFLGSDAISKTAPGGTFLLPGVNLPLFEGVLALMIVLVVHEGMHAILTRRAKVPLLSSGIVLFGIIPVGAFVEPDEEKLNKAEQSQHTRVLVGGATANLFTSLITFLIFLGITIAYNAIAGETGAALPGPLRFVMMTLGLTFALNFIVGAVNLLPLPLFDGYRLMDINIKNKNIVKAVMYITLFFFALNFVPWFFKA